MFVDFLRYQKFCFMKKSGNRPAVFKEFFYRLADRLVIAAQNGRSSCLKEVYILIAVLVVQVCSLCFCKGYRKRLVEGKVVLHTAGYVVFGFLIDSLGLCTFFIVIF